MNEGVRLHLGCGDVHKPGYVNVDMVGSGAADVKGDIMSLPFAPGSADSIDTFHVIEHFDFIHCKYLLSEWSMVLKAGGSLVIETPDLNETYRHFVRSDTDSQEKKLHWIFGIDSPGMSHKVGLSFDLARKLLEESGFVDIQRGKPSSHLYEAGLRIECAKAGQRSVRGEFAAAIRRGVLRELCNPDSYVLVPLEKHVLRILSVLPDDAPPPLDDMIAISAKMAPVNPNIAVAVLKAWKEMTQSEPDELTSAVSAVSDLCEMRIHERALALWIRAKKEGALGAQFGRFIDVLGEDLRDFVLNGGRNRDNLSYLFGLEPQSIPILDLDLVLMDARRRVNIGVKKFASGDLEGAKAILEEAADENPENLYAHWNLARLGVLMDSGRSHVDGRYRKAISLSHDTRFERAVQDEFARYTSGHTEDIPRTPVTE